MEEVKEGDVCKDDFVTNVSYTYSPTGTETITAAYPLSPGILLYHFSYGKKFTKFALNMNKFSIAFQFQFQFRIL